MQQSTGARLDNAFILENQLADYCVNRRLKEPTGKSIIKSWQLHTKDYWFYFVNIVVTPLIQGRDGVWFAGA